MGGAHERLAYQPGQVALIRSAQNDHLSSLSRPRIVIDLAASITFGSAVGASEPWCQIQLTIMKFCIRIRYPASSCAGATRLFRHVRALGRSVRATQITRFGRDAGGQADAADGRP